MRVLVAGRQKLIHFDPWNKIPFFVTVEPFLSVFFAGNIFGEFRKKKKEKNGTQKLPTRRKNCGKKKFKNRVRGKKEKEL